MPVPKDPDKRAYMFSDDMKFVQKVVVFHPSEDKFLIIRRIPTAHARPNEWDFPGGNVLFGENHLLSLKREIIEETGLKVENIRPIQVLTNFEKEIYYLFINYSCKALTSDITLSEEHTEFKWVTKEEFKELEAAAFLKELTKDFTF